MLRFHRTTSAPNPYLYGVEKLTERYGMLGVRYANAVNNQRAREGLDAADYPEGAEFRADKLWRGRGEHVPGSRFLVRHKDTGKLYLGFMPRNHNGLPACGIDRWRDVATGANLDPARLVDYLPVKTTPTNQGTRKEIFWRTIALDNIILIKSGEVYRIAA
jgi:hypothetical protein